MKRFVTRVVLEFVAIAAVTITAIQFVKNGHSAFGLSVLSIYAMFNLCRLGMSKIDAEYRENINKGRQRRLEEDLSIKEAQMRRLEAALVDAASETLWVSDIKVRGDKVVYKIDVPGRGRIVIYLPADATKTEDVPETFKEG